MPGVCRNIDIAGGLLIATQSTVKANGNSIIRNGDPVTPHGINLHAAPVITAGSNNVFIGGVAVVNAGDLATCLHPALPGSSNVNVGD
jgi:uncharacterized Zn-binding protein involved in type VI secretion|tara:strand:- start:305 stop:568 length:264 start_codon:yes stop_codon:yes gene_type:complete